MSGANELVIHGAELHVQDQGTYNKGNKSIGGFVSAYNRVGGQQSNAVMNPLKSSNASRFYKGYAEKLAKKHEEKDQHYKSIYGSEAFKTSSKKENVRDITNAAKRP